MVDVKMPHWGHDEHLCLLENVGYLRVSFEDYKKLVKGARFVCKGQSHFPVDCLCR